MRKILISLILSMAAPIAGAAFPDNQRQCLSEQAFSDLEHGANAKIVRWEFPDGSRSPSVLIILRMLNSDVFSRIRNQRRELPLIDQDVAIRTAFELAEILPILPGVGRPQMSDSPPDMKWYQSESAYRCVIRINDVGRRTCQQMILFNCGGETEVIPLESYQAKRARLLYDFGRAYETTLPALDQHDQWNQRRDRRDSGW